MPRWVKAVGGAVITAVGLGASILAYVQTSKETWHEIGDFLYPEVVIVALGVLLLIAVGVIAVMHRQRNKSFDPAEQHRVDEVLSTLPRVFMDNVAYADYVAPWRDNIG